MAPATGAGLIPSDEHLTEAERVAVDALGRCLDSPADAGLVKVANHEGYPVRSTTVAPGAFFCTPSMPFWALALVL